MISHVTFPIDESEDTKGRSRRWSSLTQRKLISSVCVLALVFCTSTLFLLLHLSTVTQDHHHEQDLVIEIDQGQGAALIKQLSNEKHRLQHLVHDKRAQHPEDLVQDVHSHDLYDKISLVEKIVKENDELSREINGKLKSKSEHEKMRENSAEKAAKVPQVPLDEMAKLGEAQLKDNSIFNHGSLYRVKGEGNTEPVSAEETIKRKHSIRSSMQGIWARYKECAWGFDHLHPDTCKGSNWFNFGLTIIDSLDTLFLMGLTEELREAQEWVRHLDFRKGANNANLFEMTIRVLGAMVSMSTLTREPLYIEKAKELGDILLVCFNTESGIPLSDIDFKTGTAHRPTCPGCSSQSSLSEATTLQLEFNELTRLTKDIKYHLASDKAMSVVLSRVPSNGLMKNYIDVNTGESSGAITLGARGDSYYEYLLKQWIQTGEHRFKVAYMTAIQGVKDRLIFSSQRNLTYVAELTGEISHKMDHLVCFLPGVLALGTMYDCPGWHLTLGEAVIRTLITNITRAVPPFVPGEAVIRTCMEMYNTRSGLAPEIVKFKAKSLFIVPNDEFSLLRPETVESLFVLWRVTHKNVYRNWAWDIYSSIERSAKTKQGYSSMNKVNTEHPQRRDSMESFFLAETIKYLYLIHGPDDVLPLTRYVFNTEAHPLPILPQELKDLANQT